MRLMIDEGKCKTAGICVKRCPQVFQFTRGSKKAMVITDPIPKEFELLCRDLIIACPEDAIIQIKD